MYKYSLLVLMLLPLGGCVVFRNFPKTEQVIPVNGLSLSLKQPKHSFQIGQPVLLEVCFENVSGKFLQTLPFCPEMGWTEGALLCGTTIHLRCTTRVHVKRISGRKEDSLRDITESIETERDPIELQPGEKKSFFFDLNNLFLDAEEDTISSPGRFEVSVEFISAVWPYNYNDPWLRSRWIGEVTSNKIIIEIVPQKETHRAAKAPAEGDFSKGVAPVPVTP